MNAFRWFVTPLAAIAVWFLVLAIGAWFDARTEVWWCGREAVLDYTCQQPRWLHELNIGLFAAVSAVAVILAMWWVVPLRTPSVAWSLFLVGAVTAAGMGIVAGLWVPTATAIAAGAATAITLTRGRSAP